MLALICGSTFAAAPPAHGWRAESAPPLPSDAMRLTFALRLADPVALEAKLYAVSTPGTAEYGKFLTLEQVDAQFPAATGAAAAVEKWLRSSAAAVSSHVIHMDTSVEGFVQASLEVRAVEALFEGVSVARWTSVASGKSTLRARERVAGRALPSAIAGYVSFVRGVDQLPRRQQRFHSAEPTTLEKARNYGTDPPSLRARYGLGLTAATNAKSTQATANFLGEGYTDDDLRFFFECFDSSADAGKVSKVVGQNNAASLEASLDIQYIMSIGSGATTWWISDDDTHEQQEPFLAYMLLLAKTPDLPFVHSVSYADLESGVEIAYAQRVDLEFAKAGVRGLSILVASGDNGSGCTKAKDHFVAQWPSSSPYVTTVGATEVNTASAAASTAASEQAAEFSGGGFSTLFSRPKYQDAAVAAYVANNALPTPATFYNTSGRAVPDVAAIGTLYSVIVDQTPTVVAGTSASTPTWSGVVTLLNDARFNAKLPPLGFLNPWLYSLSHGELRDVSTGESTPTGMVGGTCGPAQDGWKAVKGYDPVSGLGVPVFNALRAAAINATALFAR
jgi:tripeptidyl-peptidase-1